MRSGLRAYRREKRHGFRFLPRAPHRRSRHVRRLYRELIYTTLRHLPWIEPVLETTPAEAVRRVGPGKALQGNLDPAVLFAGSAAVEAEARRIAHEADEAITMGAAGHIFNLGHGVLPDTDPGVLTALVQLVHEL